MTRSFTITVEGLPASAQDVVVMQPLVGAVGYTLKKKFGDDINVTVSSQHGPSELHWTSKPPGLWTVGDALRRARA